MTTLSACFGSLGAAYLADHVGRKWVYALGLIFSYVGITLELVATTNAVFFGGKFIKYIQFLAPLAGMQDADALILVGSRLVHS